MALPYILISGKDATKATKTDMINVLTAAMHWESLNMHVQYITSLGAKEREALDYYRGMGSTPMNMYLRSGEIQVSPFDWSSFRNISESMTLSATQVKKLASKSSTVAIRDEIAQKVMKSSITQMKDNISRNIEKSMLVVEHVKLLREVIDNSPDLDRNMTLWRGEYLNIDYFYRPQSKRDIADSKHAFAMRDLKKGDKFTRHDFTSFSFDVHTSYNFTESGCCLFKFSAKKGGNILVLDPHSRPKEYECIAQAGMKFKVTNVRDVASKVTKHFSFRVVEIAQDI
jgi:hypothetical protein